MFTPLSLLPPSNSISYLSYSILPFAITQLLASFELTLPPWEGVEMNWESYLGEERIQVQWRESCLGIHIEVGE